MDQVLGEIVFDSTFFGENGLGFYVIEAHRVTDKNMYIQLATLNGKPLNVAKFHPNDIIAGGAFTPEMEDLYLADNIYGLPIGFGSLMANTGPGKETAQYPKDLIQFTS